MPVRLSLKDIVDRFMEKLRSTGSASIAYKLDFERKVGRIVIDRETYETEYIAFTPLANAVKEAVEREYGELKLVGTIGFRGEIFENPRVYLRIEAGWGLLWIDGNLKGG